MAAEDATPSPVEPTPITTEPSKSWWTKLVQTTYAPAAAAAVLALIVAGGLSFQNNQLGNEIDTLRAEIAVESAVVANLKSDLSTTVSDSETRVATMKTEMDQMEDDFGTTADLVVHQEQMVSELATANEALRQAIRDQSWLTYVAMNEDYQLASWLASEQTAVQSNASGLIAVRMVGNEAVFEVHGLPQPQPGKAYTLWLLGNGHPQPVSQCEVSEIGSATVVFLLPAPLQYYSSVAVTQEQVNDVGPDPTGIMVLSAETN